jgi:hypothetical protein
MRPDIDELMDTLELSEANPWLRMVVDGMAYLRDRIEQSGREQRG